MTVAPGPCAVGFVPSSPLLIPELAGATPGRPDAIRAAARQVVAEILSHDTDCVVIVGACAAPHLDGTVATADFSGFGLPRTESGGGRALPWQLGLGAWLLDDAGWDGPRDFVGAPSPISRPAGGRTAYLAVGDGSVRLPDDPSDGADKEREAFDQAVARAVADGDAASLSRLVSTAAETIGAGGLPVWAYVAAITEGAAVTTSRLVYDSAPYGVRYLSGWWLL